ncbi:hypothetical protein [Gracilibacillus kekensis]|uniref:DUF4129 domain-containing protein n=1 Tax=Gracilibacillus kekensis TaxID=1027249 RepID=A0A1M7MY31_9BACI|nr:hypothetical protein [Gracilibacillus kekensis]SHM96104.1 hypothetical protein SAMN05216179_1426 [Gracilibacillus kekensis]
MPVNIRNHLASIFHGVVEFIGFFPVFLLVAVLFFDTPDRYFWYIALLALFVACYFVRLLIKNRWNVLVIAIVLTIFTNMLVMTSVWSLIPGILIGFVVSFRGIQHAENEWEDILPSRIFWAVSMPIYFVGYILFINLDTLAAYQSQISYVGFLFIIIMLFITNQEHLQKESLASGKKKKIGGEITRLNRIYLVLTLFLVFAITNFQVVQAAVYNGVRSMIESVMWFASLFGNDSEPIQDEPQANEMPAFPQAESEPSKFAGWTDQIMYIIGIVMAICLVLLFLALLFKKSRDLLKRIVRSLWAIIKNITGKRDLAETTDYQDEKENLFDWRKWRKENQEKIGEAFRRITKSKPKFEQMTKEEKVRFLYRLVALDLKKQEKWRASLTAHEVLALNEKDQLLKRLENMYDDIRYGNKNIAQEDEQPLCEIWRKLKEQK